MPIQILLDTWSMNPGRGMVDTYVGGVGCHLVVVDLAVVARLASHWLLSVLFNTLLLYVLFVI